MFSNVIGLQKQKALLKSMVDEDRVPHALLLLGNEGVGGLALALAYIQYLVCEHRNGDDACGACKACTKASKYIHPDIHYSYPTIGANKVATDFLVEWRKMLGERHGYFSANGWLTYISNGESKQGNITKDECVSIVKKLSLKAFESRYKILLMWLPEYLGKEGNRLLKLIEEPTENTIFVLVAENQESILPTVLSRCQLVQLSPLSEDDIKKALVARYQIPSEKAEAVALLADGNFNEALFLAQHDENDNAMLFLDWMRKCYNGNGVDIIQWSERLAASSREAQKYFLRYGLHFIREYMRLKISNGTTKVRLQHHELDTASKMLQVISMGQIEPINTLFNQAIAAIERNGNGKIVFADTSIQLYKILRQK